MCEKALEVGAAELELVEAKANQKDAKEALVGETGKCAKSCKKSIKLPRALSLKPKKP